MSIDLKTTIVFQKNYNALMARNNDGSRKYKYIINMGSSRSSKTYSLIDIFDLYARQNKNERLTIWRDTKTDCKKTVLSDMLKYHKKTNRYLVNYTFNKTDSIFHYSDDGGKSTTTVEIHGTDDEETVHGLTQQIAWLNEPYKISKDTFDQIDMRAEVIFIDYNPKKDHWVDDLMKLENAIVIHSTYKDNPFCPEESRIKIQSYQPLSYAYLVQNKLEDESIIKKFENAYILSDYLDKKDYEPKYKRELIRTYKNEKQLTANEYKHNVYALGLKAENPNKIYNNWIPFYDSDFERLKKERHLQSYYGLDFGYAHKSACVEIMYDGDRTFYVRQKLYKALKDTDQSLGDLLTAAGVPTGEVTYIACDSQDNLNGVSSSLVYDLRTYHGLNCYKVNKPKYIDRFHFINNCFIYYTVESKDLEKEYESYEYEFINGMTTEKPIKVDDDLINAMEYGIFFIKDLFKIHI